MIKFLRRLWYLSTRKHKHDYIKKRIIKGTMCPNFSLCSNSRANYDVTRLVFSNIAVEVAVSVDVMTGNIVKKFVPSRQRRINLEVRLYMEPSSQKSIYIEWKYLLPRKK